MRIMRPKGTGLFDEAWDKFRKDKKYKDALEVIDEIWFFYDVEKEDVPKWEHRLDIIDLFDNPTSAYQIGDGIRQFD